MDASPSSLKVFTRLKSMVPMFRGTNTFHETECLHGVASVNPTTLSSYPMLKYPSSAHTRETYMIKMLQPGGLEGSNRRRPNPGENLITTVRIILRYCIW